MKLNHLLLGALGLMLLATACDPQDKTKNSPSFELPQPVDVVMYQVNPRVFAADSSLKAVEARLDEIAELGTNVVWVMPIYPIGTEKTKNSPYSIKDYKAVAPEFGTVDDMRSLVAACHERGMGLIMDWVANHTAWDNPWLKEHPEWYTHDNDGNIVFPPHTDWTDVADLNYDNRGLRDAMIDAMLFWVREVGIDGFRCDVADMVPADFWREAIDTVRRAAAPRRILMLAEGKRNDNFVAGFDMNYAWDFKDQLVRVFVGGEPATSLMTTDAAEYDSIPEGKVKLRFTTNHDHAAQASPLTELGGDQAAMAAFAGTALLHGAPLVYGSQEVGYEMPINFFHYVKVDWNARPELRKQYIALLNAYVKYPTLHGAPTDDLTTADVLAYGKHGADGDFLVLVNVRSDEQRFEVPENWRGQKMTDLAHDGAVVVLSETLVLPPYSYKLLRAE